MLLWLAVIAIASAASRPAAADKTNAFSFNQPVLPDCGGIDFRACRAHLIKAIFNATALPDRVVPDRIERISNYTMTGYAGPGTGVGFSVSGWQNNLTALTWTIESPFVTLNSTVFWTLNTSGAASGNFPPPPGVPNMPSPQLYAPTLSDTLVLYHNGASPSAHFLHRHSS